MQVSRKKPARKTKVMNDWKNKFQRKLQKTHGNHWQNIFHRLMKKSSTLKTSLKRRSKEYEVEFNISLKEIRDEIYDAYKESQKNKLKHLFNNLKNLHFCNIEIIGFIFDFFYCISAVIFLRN